MSYSFCKIGVHVAKDSIVETCNQLLKVGSKAIQTYLSNKTSFSPGKPLTKSEVEAILKMRAESDLYVVVHGKLIVNLCQDDMRNIPALTCDIFEANRINADVVIHQGKNVKHLSREEALSRFVINVIEALDQTAGCKNRILLENSCQQGTELGYNLEDLVTIWRLIGGTPVKDSDLDETEPEESDSKMTNYQERVGFCIDLCHAHVGGMIDMRSELAVDAFMKEFDQKIGLEHLRVIHFNDSKIKFDGHNDNHHDILAGQIGNPLLGGGSHGFRKAIEYGNRYSIPLIMEVPGNIPVNLQISLLMGWAGILPYDFEEAFLQIAQEVLVEFAGDPHSGKGKRSTKAVSSTPSNPSTPTNPVSSPIRPPIIITKRADSSNATSTGNASTSSSSVRLPVIVPRITPKPLQIIPIAKPTLKIPIARKEAVASDTHDCAVCNKEEE